MVKKRRRRRALAELVSGSLYCDDRGRPLLAIGPKEAVTRGRSEWLKVPLGESWSLAAEISTEQLARAWGVSVEDIDAMGAAYFPRTKPKDAYPVKPKAQKREPISYRVTGG